MTPEPESGDPVLAIEDLSVEFRRGADWVRVVDGVSLAVGPGETLGVVGESGSGKTVTALAAMGLLPPTGARVAAGSVRLDGRDLAGLGPAERRALRGGQMAMVFQEPMTSLNPAFTVGNQIAEAVRIHRRLSRPAARQRAVELLELVGVPDAGRRAKDYPHTFSGGMRQRAMVAMAIAGHPRLLIADEPTTALDVTIQAQVLDLLRRLQGQLDMAMLFITHDLGVVAQVCDRVAVLYAGQVVEEADAPRFFARPRHPYAKGLLEAMPQAAGPGQALRAIEGDVPRPGAFASGCRFAPRCAYAQDRCGEQPVVLESLGEGRCVRCLRQGELDLRLRPQRPGTSHTGRSSTRSGTEVELLRLVGLAKSFPVHSSLLRRVVGQVRAVDGVDLTIAPGETLGLVGESGSGKSTVARLVLRLIEPTAGTVFFAGQELTALSAKELRPARQAVQMVFQDPYSSLNPRMTVGEVVGEPLAVHQRLGAAQRSARVAELLEQVGLEAAMARRYPHELSGGQRQRVAIARALALRPRLVVCDEPISSLDVSTQSQVVNLLGDLQAELGLAYLFVSHDLAVVRRLSHRIAVMYLGRIVEVGEAAEVAERPTHPYTQALLSAVLVADPGTRRGYSVPVAGDLPSALDPPTGCRFHTRCPYAMAVCAAEEPVPFVTPAGTTVACHLHQHGPVLAGRPVRLARPPVAAGGS